MWSSTTIKIKIKPWSWTYLSSFQKTLICLLKEPISIILKNVFSCGFNFGFGSMNFFWQKITKRQHKFNPCDKAIVKSEIVFGEITKSS